MSTVAKLPPNIKLPDKIGAALDLLYKKNLKKKALEEKVKAEDAEIDLVEAHIFRLFAREGIESGRGRFLQVSKSIRYIPTVKDWEKFDAYVIKNKATDLYHRRISSTAYNARIENGEEVPGVEIFEKPVLHATTLKKKQ